MEYVFWIALLAVVYSYFGYPLILMALERLAPRPIVRVAPGFTPSVTIIVPAYNEATVIGRKLENLLNLEYPLERLQIIVVSDGSTDATDSVVEAAANDGRLTLIRVAERRGKANALNVGLTAATGEIVVFSDSSIMLDPNALRAIVVPFGDPAVGCVSGEDHIPEGGGEGLYGRYELFLRNRESAIGSIVGASGSFYAQRRDLCQPFVDGLAPDFLSVLNTVEAGYRAVTEPAAFGIMSAVRNPGEEFSRKVRTLLRGMTTLWEKRMLLNPLRYGRFAWVLLSHKVIRWLVPLFLVLLLLSGMALAKHPFYLVMLMLQCLFYGVAVLAWRRVSGLQDRVLGKVPLYFSAANLAVAVAWAKFLLGTRQEIWEPSRRK
ncbi:MAG: glycosyltransferase family 2 protein [Proteobacteria bacterium]|nr:MAG: glycosyltransferase family 2 protein [Pseudomonadota bacterium]QKK12070.1 MAG: glycosyltransferase family 2 protein [Pseudomonadota bacterium]